MTGAQLLLVLGGVGGLAWYTRARWLPGARSVGESIYGGAAPAGGTAGGGLDKAAKGITAGAAQRSLASARAQQAASPLAATAAGASARAAIVFAKMGDGPSPYSSGSGLFQPARTANETALATNIAAARRMGK